jgi:hypothetical protein
MQNAKLSFDLDNPYSIFVRQISQTLGKTSNLTKIQY